MKKTQGKSLCPLCSLWLYLIFGVDEARCIVNPASEIQSLDAIPCDVAIAHRAIGDDEFFACEQCSDSFGAGNGFGKNINCAFIDAQQIPNGETAAIGGYFG